MRLLLTILSVLAGWTLLGVLMVGLRSIMKQLESIRGYLEKIVWGVRAIERQTVPLGAHADALTTSLGETGDAVGAAADQLDKVGRDIDAAGPTLRAR
jgi:hypothetical protein